MKYRLSSAELPDRVQLLNVASAAPPPAPAVLPTRMQEFTVPPYTPPPRGAELPLITQLETTELAEPHHAPPPEVHAVPFVSVNPEITASPVRLTHRTAPAPSITVLCAPLTLRSVSGRSTSIRLGVPRTSF